MDASTRIALATCVAAWLTLVVYVALGFYAKRQLDEYRTQRRESLRPYVVVDLAVGTFVEVTVTNIGARAAHDTRLTFSDPLTSTLSDAPALKSRALREGIRMLPPSKGYSFILDATRARYKDSGLCLTYDVSVEYTDDRGTRYHEPYVLDLAGLSEATMEQTPGHAVVKALEDLRRETHKWTDGTKGLLVHSRDKDGMLRDEQAAYESWQKAQAAATEIPDPNPDEQ
jgi:hypothetical protein